MKRGWAAAGLPVALLTMIAVMALTWCVGNVSFALIRAISCPTGETSDLMPQACTICRPSRP
jgi:hypothetical protein